MTYHQKTMTLAVWCDKPGCERALRVPHPEWAPYQNEFQAWFRTTRWSLWFNRGQRHYCPDHGPNPKSSLRRLV